MYVCLYIMYIIFSYVLFSFSLNNDSTISNLRLSISFTIFFALYPLHV